MLCSKHGYVIIFVIEQAEFFFDDFSINHNTITCNMLSGAAGDI